MPKAIAENRNSSEYPNQIPPDEFKLATLSHLMWDASRNRRYAYFTVTSRFSPSALTTAERPFSDRADSDHSISNVWTINPEMIHKLARRDVSEMLHFRSCPKCITGAVESNSDPHGSFVLCLNCGFMRDIDSGLDPDSIALKLMEWKSTMPLVERQAGDPIAAA